ncbi:hypothetical protein QR680_009161 [Steinernema hermaphroditum]|uniref:Secreted protein n=1 Tax=Steinernema hermaphroditum TaxID=289476 RepID=A0AA39IJB4_9BILA|nr:hypothetical protein QR680_009161 [Steinernema hermaphroditum]
MRAARCALLLLVFAVAEVVAAKSKYFATTRPRESSPAQPYRKYHIDSEGGEHGSPLCPLCFWNCLVASLGMFGFCWGRSMGDLGE